MNWDDYYIKMAELVASKSKDKSTKVGAVIVGEDNEVRSTGYNGFPRHVNDTTEQRHARPDKYAFTEHAERNAIYNAARVGIPLNGCTLYLNWEPCPCTDCTRAVIQSGIKRIVGPNIPFGGVSSHWKKDFSHSVEMLDEARIERVYIDREG
jgi:dCMP deaminase